MTMIELNRIYNEDCLEGMKRLPDKSIDMILCEEVFNCVTIHQKTNIGSIV